VNADPGPELSFSVADQTGERLDRALQAALPALSRTAVQRLIAGGHATVDGRVERPAYRLQAGETVRWRVPKAEPVTDLQAEAIPLDVVFEDADLLVINKPRGLVVHPAPGHESGTLVNAVLAHAGDDFTGIGGVERPGIVHRLDKDTSGLMVVAKTERAYQSLQQQIAERTAERRYVAVVRGSPRFERASVDAPIGRHPTDRKKMAVIRPGSSHTHREAQTDLRVVERFTGFALLEARLQTGRTHQIRVHCAYIHLPVVGDPLYGPRNVEKDPHLEPEVRAAVRGLEGQALHAYRLALDHPAGGQQMQFLSEPPDDFRRLLDALGGVWAPEPEAPWPDG
jgi:23S rRNA pseudouridine1911/1915/1917 synthase